MDPHNPESFNHKTQRLSTGRIYHFVDQIPENYDPQRNPTLLCLHGFPDLWYGWRYQIQPWVSNGARVVVPDMLGYGETSKPLEAVHYSTKKLCADLAALLDILGIKRAVVIGHDWGAFTAGRFALWYSHRVLALVMLSVPYTPPSRVYIPIEEVAEMAPNLGYQLYFASTKSSLEVLAHLKKFLRVTFSPPHAKVAYTPVGSLEKLLLKSDVPADHPSLLNEQEFAYYHAQLSKGMHWPLNYYRTSQYRHEEELEYGLPANLRADLPFLFMWGTEDATATPFVINKSKKFIPHYQDLALEGRGHWLMIEAKDEVTDTVINWLQSLTSSKPEIQTKL